jgi:hypothetical protein
MCKTPAKTLDQNHPTQRAPHDFTCGALFDVKFIIPATEMAMQERVGARQRRDLPD